VITEEVHHIHRDDVTPWSYNCAGDVPLENVQNVGCSGKEPAGEVKRVVGEAVTSKMVALVCFVYLVEPD
jgi:hypothetical protein